MSQGNQAPNQDLERLASLSFVDFCAELNVKLEPGQRVIAKVAYDGVNPKALKAEEKQLALQIFGDIQEVQKVSRGVFTAVCGARGGKSYVLLGLRVLWGALRRDFSKVVPGNVPVGLIVAPGIKLARETLAYVEGAVREHPTLSAALLSDSDDTLLLQRPDGRKVSIEVLPATRGGASIRGRWYTDAALDECAFFRDESFIVNDKDIYNAASPRILPGGQMLLASTPWAESGLLYELFRENWGAPATALVAHAPTLTLRNLPEVREIVDRERLRDPSNCDREYLAIFSPIGAEQFFSAAEIDACTESYPLGQKAEYGDQVIAACDLGFRHDCSVLVVVHLNSKEVRRVVEVVELIPKPGAPLRPSEVLSTFVEVCKKHGATYVIGDHHYKETICEFLAESDIGYMDAPSQPADAYIKARALLREGLVVLPEHERLLRQMRETKSRLTPGGTVSISNPRWKKGGHGDIVSALVLALWASAGDTIPLPSPEPGTRAWEADRKDERLKKQVDKNGPRKWWMRAGRKAAKS